MTCGCSTPEGIGAAVTGPTSAGCRWGELCSTPEGIGAAVTWEEGRGPQAARRVLNARRHRSGGHVDDVELNPEHIKLCSTPEGIGAAVTRDPPARSPPPDRAQRPKASERRSHVRPLRSRVRAVLCSTPEGIGAAVTKGGKAIGRGGGHECSTPEGIGAAVTRGGVEGRGGSHRVLNARRHRSGGHQRHAGGGSRT